MGMFDQARRWWQEYTGEDETPLDGDTPAWVVSLGLLGAVLLVLAVAGLGVMPRSVTQVTVRASARPEQSGRAPELPTHVSRLIAHPLSH